MSSSFWPFNSDVISSSLPKSARYVGALSRQGKMSPRFIVEYFTKCFRRRDCDPLPFSCSVRPPAKTFNCFCCTEVTMIEECCDETITG